VTSGGPDSPAARLAGRVALPLALAVLGLVVWRSAFLIDDAFISFRYAAHWAAGQGLVYDLAPGAEPVEGYSNFLWVALLALGRVLGLAPETFASVLSVLSAAGTVVLVRRFLAERLALDGSSVLLGTLALAAYPVFGVWATGGLETALFGLLLFGAWTLLVAEPAGVDSNQTEGTSAETRLGLLAGLVGGALILTRVEGFLWIGGLWLAAFVALRRDLPKRRVALFLGVSLTVLAAQLAIRHVVYGELVANTVLAKSGLSGATLVRGLKGLATWGLLFVWPVAALFAPLAAGQGRRRALAISAFVMAGGALDYSVLTGGDWMPFFRFLAPASAFFAVLLAVGLERFGARARLGLGVAAIAVAALPLVDLALVPRAWREALYFREFRIGYQTEWERWTTGAANTERNTWLGHSLAAVSGPEETWTGGAIGAVAYYSEVTILDRNGLVNREVAAREVEPGSGTAGHDKRVPRAYFEDRAPTFYEVLYAPIALPQQGPAFDQAVRQMHATVFRDAEEAPLLRCTRVEVRSVRDVPGLPPRASVVLLVHTDERSARAFWSRYGL